MTQVAPLAELHLRAHRAALQAGEKTKWWDGSMETGLAAAAGALHPKGAYRPLGSLGLQGLKQWIENQDVRPIGEDAAALALGAFAAQRLGDDPHWFRKEAFRLLTDVLHRSRAPLAPLHLALAAWALRQIATPNEKRPWPELRAKFDELPTLGVDQLLVKYGQLLTTKDIDAVELTRILQSPPDVDQSEYAILLWVMWTGSLLLTQLLPDNDPSLEVVRQRRDEVFEYVAVGVRDKDMTIEGAGDYSPLPDPDSPDVSHPPDTFEMLMIDLALSADATGESLRTPSEADVLVRRGRDRAVRYLTAAIELLAAMTTALVIAVAKFHYHARFGLVLGSGMLAFGLMTVPALKAWNAVKEARVPRRPFTGATLAVLLLGAAIVGNWVPKSPVFSVSDFAVAAVAIGGPILFGFLLAFLDWWLEGREVAPPE